MLLVVECVTERGAMRDSALESRSPQLVTLLLPRHPRQPSAAQCVTAPLASVGKRQKGIEKFSAVSADRQEEANDALDDVSGDAGEALKLVLCSCYFSWAGFALQA